MSRYRSVDSQCGYRSIQLMWKESGVAYDVKPHINFTIGTLMSLREIDLLAETYYDCENGVYDLFTQYNIDFVHYKLSP